MTSIVEAYNQAMDDAFYLPLPTGYEEPDDLFEINDVGFIHRHYTRTATGYHGFVLTVHYDHYLGGRRTWEAEVARIMTSPVERRYIQFISGFGSRPFFHRMWYATYDSRGSRYYSSWEPHLPHWKSIPFSATREQVFDHVFHFLAYQVAMYKEGLEAFVNDERCQGI